MRRAYTSPVISAGYTFFSTVPPTTGLALWLRADTGVTTSGSAVTAGRPVGRRLYRIAKHTAEQPTLVSNGIGSMPALGFNGGARAGKYDGERVALRQCPHGLRGGGMPMRRGTAGRFCPFARWDPVCRIRVQRQL